MSVTNDNQLLSSASSAICLLLTINKNLVTICESLLVGNICGKQNDQAKWRTLLDAYVQQWITIGGRQYGDMELGYMTDIYAASFRNAWASMITRRRIRQNKQCFILKWDSMGKVLIRKYLKPEYKFVYIQNELPRLS